MLRHTRGTARASTWLLLMIASACGGTSNQPPETPHAAPLPSEDATKAAHVMTAFGQGEAGNCASISVIKLALFTYGFDGTFAAIESDTRGSKMTLRDGHVITITDEEVRRVGAVAYF